MTPWPAQRKQRDGSPGSAIIQPGFRLRPARPGCRAAVLGLFPGVRVHDWMPIEEIGLVVSYRCECGRTKTRIAGGAPRDRRRESSLTLSAPRVWTCRS
jgi:hypothetical protein